MVKIKIKSIRRSKGYTIRQLSEMSGISKSQIARIENGEQSPTIDTLCEIAKALGVSANDTYEYIAENPQG